VPSNNRIVGQLSGTPGGDGTYQVVAAYGPWVQDWVQLKRQEWLLILGKRHQSDNRDKSEASSRLFLTARPTCPPAVDRRAHLNDASNAPGDCRRGGRARQEGFHRVTESVILH
jgi:hypothetical protein